MLGLYEEVKCNMGAFIPMWCLPLVIGVVVVAGSALPSLQWVLAFGGLAFFFWAFSRAVRPYLEKRIGLFTTILLAIIMPIVFCIVLAALPFIIWPLLRP